ncbi:serine protease [Plakobranchus ocellatus]|uniref:Serine protease n=1 Tax=Plakobranchus ocellatus TaxID=259542 RepID=A0AAV4CCF8_9GAST|nr:serine protease [Plakobranchus ocellatus]
MIAGFLAFIRTGLEVATENPLIEFLRNNEFNRDVTLSGQGVAVSRREVTVNERGNNVRLRSFGQLTFSGVLVKDNWVLTAASCFEGLRVCSCSLCLRSIKCTIISRNYNSSLWAAVLHDLSSTTVDPGEEVIYVESIFLYGGFKRGNFQNNIALVKLKSPETPDTQLPTPACVANGTEDLTTDCIIAGWGSTRPVEAPSDILRKVKVKLMSYQDCVRQQDRVMASISVGQLCVISADDSKAAETSETEGPCTGDRGSPVLCKTKERWSVVGVVSDEYACRSNQQTTPMVVDVAHFSFWINKIMSQF